MPILAFFISERYTFQIPTQSRYLWYSLVFELVLDKKDDLECRLWFPVLPLAVRPEAPWRIPHLQAARVIHRLEQTIACRNVLNFGTGTRTETFAQLWD